MNSESHEPLEGELGRAVAVVRSQEPPPELVDRVMSKASTIPATVVRPRRSLRVWGVLALLAASLFIGVAVGHFVAVSRQPHDSVAVAELKKHRSDLDRSVSKQTRDAELEARKATAVAEALKVEIQSLDAGRPGLPRATTPSIKYEPMPGNHLIPGRQQVNDALPFQRPVAGEFAPVEKRVKVFTERMNTGRVEGLAREREEEEEDAYHRTTQFKHFASNPFLRVAQDPLSTFSSDVDTASYSIVRKFLKDERKLPPPDAVRVEEMINYFEYNYPQPTGEHPVSITPAVAACPWNKDHRLVRIGVQARRIKSDDMPARNLVFLIDVSGSMAPSNRLPLVKEAFGLLIDQLTGKDRVSIVVYAGVSGVALTSTPGSEKDTIRKAVNGLGAGGSTNGAGGIIAAYQEAQKNFIHGGTNRVILATDGDFNVGTTSEGDLVRLIEEHRNKGVYFTALGFGMGNLKDSTIMKLANHGHGHYAYIDTLAEAKKVFVEEGMSLVTLAQDVKLQVEFNPKTVEAYRLIGYEKRLMRHEDFNDDSKLAAVLGCGHRVTVLYEVVPVGKPADVSRVDPLRYQAPATLTKAAESKELMAVKLRYKEPMGQKSKLMETPVNDNAGGFDQASPDFRWAAAVAAFGRILRDNPQNAGINLAGVKELAESSRGTDARGWRSEFIELVKRAEKLVK